MLCVASLKVNSSLRVILNKSWKIHALHHSQISFYHPFVKQLLSVCRFVVFLMASIMTRHTIYDGYRVRELTQSVELLPVSGQVV